MSENATKRPNIPCGEGHTLRDNGLGDCNLICPKLGDMGFMHLGQVMMIEEGSAVCRCGAKLGPVDNLTVT